MERGGEKTVFLVLSVPVDRIVWENWGTAQVLLKEIEISVGGSELGCCWFVNLFFFFFSVIFIIVYLFLLSFCTSWIH